MDEERFLEIRHQKSKAFGWGIPAMFLIALSINYLTQAKEPLLKLAILVVSLIPGILVVAFFWPKISRGEKIEYNEINTNLGKTYYWWDKISPFEKIKLMETYKK